MMDTIGVGDRALTVYGPEVLLSGLVADLDRFLTHRSGVTLAERFFVLHDAASITRFYEMTGSTTGAHWPLVVDLFDGRPCLVSIWSGAEALPRLQRLKGATQPCNAGRDSVRGNFACDNPVCNLIHVSDTPELAAEEIPLLRGRALGSSGGDATTAGSASERCRHSSLWTFAAILNRVDPSLEMPEADELTSAQAAAFTAIGWLHGVGERQPHLRDLIGAFLEGRHSDTLSALPAGFRMTAWERLIVECGCHSTPLWVDRLNLRHEVGVRPCL